MTDKTRAEFESFVSSQGLSTAIYNDLYRSQIVGIMWKTWQAAKGKYEPRWIPIETAPNAHGERVLILKDCGEGSLPSKSVAYRLEGRPEWYFSDASHETIESYGYRVTHWMPLPSAPSTQGGGE